MQPHKRARIHPVRRRRIRNLVPDRIHRCLESAEIDVVRTFRPCNSRFHPASCPSDSQLPRKYRLSRSNSCVAIRNQSLRRRAARCGRINHHIVHVEPGVSAAYVGSPTWIAAAVPAYRNTVPPWLPLAVAPPRTRIRAAQHCAFPPSPQSGSPSRSSRTAAYTVALAVEIVTFDPIAACPVKFRASHVPP